MRKPAKFLSAAVALLLLAVIGSAGIVAMAATGETTSGTSGAAVSDGSAAIDSAKASQNTDSSKKGHKGKKAGVHVNVISVAASVLGKTEEEVKTSVKAGKVGDLLAAAGKVEEFKTAYLDQLKTRLDAAVTAGTLTREQADEKYASGKEKMDAYDGTTHLCGGKDHSKMLEKRSKPTTGSDSET